MSFVQFQRRLDHSSVAVAAAAGAGDQPPRRPMGLTVDNERQRQALLKFAAFAGCCGWDNCSVAGKNRKKHWMKRLQRKKSKDPLGSLATEAGVGEKQTPGFTADQEKEKETFARLTRLATELSLTTAAIVVDGMKTALEAAKDIGPLSDDEKGSDWKTFCSRSGSIIGDCCSCRSSRSSSSSGSDEKSAGGRGCQESQPEHLNQV